jgi:CMP-N,N'-diacetyllegionaminic acid synthase
VRCDSRACVSVTPNPKPLVWNYTLQESRLCPVVSDLQINCRQAARITYHLNGAIYVARIESLLATGTFLSDDAVAYVMPTERSADVDTTLDLKWCEFMLSAQHRSP